MKLSRNGGVMTLSRSNLLALLAKLDEPGSKRMIANDEFVIEAEEDEVHYKDRPRGIMRDITERRMEDLRGSPKSPIVWEVGPTRANCSCGQPIHPDDGVHCYECILKDLEDLRDQQDDALGG